jgi:7-cyano-7-deazaguanine synthase in queuosine biosynthesis
MTHHTLIARLGSADTASIAHRSTSRLVDLPYLDGNGRLTHGIGDALRQLSKMGFRPSETAVDLVLLAATVTAADTRVSRAIHGQDRWTRELALSVPVHDPALWDAQRLRLERMLRFLTGDRWELAFRSRPAGVTELASESEALRLLQPTCVSLFSGGLDSFIGAIDLLAAGERPIFVSHWYDAITSSHQTDCAAQLAKRFGDTAFAQVRAHTGFRVDIVDEGETENTLRARSFLFFALAAATADALGGDRTIYVPENGLISLNVPLDPLRIGALSTRTTHPYYMARFNELLGAVGIRSSLHNPYAFLTKGQMARACADPDFLKRTAKRTMSCSSPANGRFERDPTLRELIHCGRCVPCLIRRASFKAGIGVDRTKYRAPSLTAEIFNSHTARGADIRAFQVAIARLKADPHRAATDIHRPGPLIDHPDRWADYERVYREGMAEVDRILRRVTAKPLS